MIEGNKTDDTTNFTLMDSNNIIGDNIVPNCLNSLLPEGEDTLSHDAKFPQDPFVWVVEGVFILIAFLVGMFGNSFSVIVYSRQKVHRIFHNLLLLLAIFDIICIGSSFLLYSLPQFAPVYKTMIGLYVKSFIPPLGHIGMMGSVWCTVALTIERYLAVCYPFFSRRGVYSSMSFITPVIAFTLVYNIPKFFELEVKVTNYIDHTNNSSLESCVRNVFGAAELNDYNQQFSSFSNESSKLSEEIFANITTTMQRNSSSTNNTSSFYSSNKKANFSVEQLYSEVLANCCSCTINVINENRNSNNSTCNTDYICDIFIAQLIEFSANIEGEIRNESFFVDENVR